MSLFCAFLNQDSSYTVSKDCHGVVYQALLKKNENESRITRKTRNSFKKDIRRSERKHVRYLRIWGKNRLLAFSGLLKIIGIVFTARNHLQPGWGFDLGLGLRMDISVMSHS